MEHGKKMFIDGHEMTVFTDSGAQRDALEKFLEASADFISSILARVPEDTRAEINRRQHSGEEAFFVSLLYQEGAVEVRGDILSEKGALPLFKTKVDARKNKKGH